MARMTRLRQSFRQSGRNPQVASAIFATVNLIGNRTALWLRIPRAICSNASSWPRAMAAAIFFCSMVKEPTGSGGAAGIPETGPRRRLFHQVERGVVIHILPRGPGPGHHGPFRVGQFSQPARVRFEAESGIVRHHHRDVRRAILYRPPDRDGIRHPAVGVGLAVHIIIPARRQSHGRRGAESRKDPVVADVEVNRLAGVTVGQHDVKTVGAFCSASTESGTRFRMIWSTR